MVRILAMILLQVFILFIPLSKAQQFKIFFNSVQIEQEDKLHFPNIRLFDPSDPDILSGVFSAEFVFNPNTLSFELDVSSLKYYPEVGVFYEWLMAKDVEPKQPTYYVGKDTYHCGREYAFSSSKKSPFVATLNLKVGHVISWRISYQSCDYKWILINAKNGKIMDEFFGEAYHGVISDAHKILEDGIYLLKVEPIGDCDSMSFNLEIFNANNRNLIEVHDGDSISEDFKTNVRDYAKFKVYLKKGEILKLSEGDSDIAIKLINSYSNKVADVRGLPLIYQAKETGYYYIFIYNNKGWGGSYYGEVSIYTED